MDRSTLAGWVEAEWRSFWAGTEYKRLHNPDKAFLGWLRGKAGQGV